VLTNQTGAYHERIEYLPYGEVWVEDQATSGGYTTPYKFTGKELDKETNLYYFGARYYDARIGRWISTDPALVEGKYFPKPNDYDTEHDFYWYYKNQDIKKLKGIGGIYRPINLDTYRYCGNNPIIITDPDGKTDNKTYITDPEGNNKTIAPVSVKGAPKVDIVKIAKAQQEQQKKTVEAQKRSQQQHTGMLIAAGSVMVAGAAAIPVVTIGAMEAGPILIGAIDKVGGAVVSTQTGAILGRAGIDISNMIKVGLADIMTNSIINGPSIVSGFLQGITPSGPIVTNNENEAKGWVAGLIYDKIKDYTGK